MKTLLIIIGTIVSIIIVSLISIGIYAKFWWDDITFKPEVDKSKINLQSILTNLLINKNVSLPINLIVNNKNNIGLTLNNVFIKIYYNDVQVFQSDTIEILSIPRNARDYSIPLNVQIFANIESVKLINELIRENEPMTEIVLSVSKFNQTREFSFPYKIEKF